MHQCIDLYLYDWDYANLTSVNEWLFGLAIVVSRSTKLLKRLILNIGCPIAHNSAVCVNYILYDIVNV